MPDLLLPALIAPGAAPFLPLESITWRVDVTGPLARVEVVERFRNTTAGLVDAVYVFPLAPGAAIDGMHLRIGTREVDGTIRARDQARAAYEAAREEGRTAALTEELRSDVFTQDVANLPPGEAIEVTLSVIQPVAWDGDHWHLTVPLLAPPRFLPLGSPPVLASLAAGSPRDTGVRARVELRVQAGNAVRDLWADPLPRDVRPDLLGSAARLSLDELPLTADLEVGWRTRRDRASAALLVSDTHVLVVTEAGSQGGGSPGWLDWSGCPVVDEVVLAAGVGSYHLGQRAGPCNGPVVVRGGAADLWLWPRAAEDPHTLASSWARSVVEELAQRPGSEPRILELGLAYGLVTSETSFVAVDSAGPVRVAHPPPATAWSVGLASGALEGLGAVEPVTALPPPPAKAAREEEKEDAEYERISSEKWLEAIDKLEALLTKGVPDETRAEMVLRLADMYMQVAFADPSADQDWYERAIRLYQGLLRNHPDFARLDQVLFMLGRALAAVGRHDEATAAYEELARRFPTSQYTPDAGAGR